MTKPSAEPVDSPAEQAMQQTCEKCGTKWTADEFLPCPVCVQIGTCLKCGEQICNTDAMDLFRECTRLKKQNEVLKKGLEYYANENNWDAEGHMYIKVGETAMGEFYTEDFGRIALAALAEAEGVGE